jgi:hypothetical protein
MTYAAITGFPPIVFYFSRHVASFSGELKIREFSYHPSIDELQMVAFKVAYARLAIDERVVPDKPHDFVSGTKCGFCSWKGHCWGEEKHEFEYPLISPEIHLKLVRRATKWAKELVNADALAHRRRGVLLHIAKHGSEKAQELLTGDWSGLLGEIPKD